jgi:hypothetical protein
MAGKKASKKLKKGKKLEEKKPLSFSWGASNSASIGSATSGGGAGR